MDSRNALTRIGVRAAAGLAGVAAAAAVVGLALSTPIAGAEAKPVARTIAPVPADAQAVCPGPLLQLGAGDSATSVSPLGAAATRYGGSTGSITSARLSALDSTNPSSGPMVYTEPAGAEAKVAPLLAAAQLQAVDGAEMQGLAVADCAPPDYDSWLVAGSTSLGSTSILTLANPGGVAATVSLDLYSEEGQVEANGTHGILVQPRTQRALALSGFAPNASALAVHVTSTGAAVSAQVEESQITGVTPQGADWAGPTAAPAKHVVIPGAVLDTTAVSENAGSDTDGGGVPVLRVLPIGDKDAKLTIGVKPEAGTTGGNAATVTVSHGIVSEIPLDKLGNGTFTVTVDSTVPLVGAVRTTTVDADKGTDLAWYAGARALKGPAAIPVAAGLPGTLHLVNPGSRKAAVELREAGQKTRTVSVAGGASIALSTAPGVITLPDAGGLLASVSFAAPGKVAGYVAYPTGASASALTVYDR